MGFAVLLLIGSMLLLLRPQNYDVERRNAQRQTDVAHILQIVNDYRAANGGAWPSQVSEIETMITTTETDNGLCDVLVPAYAQDLPLDPVIGVKMIDDESCAVEDQAYLTGYTIAVTDGHVVVGAPAAEDAIIRVER